MTRFLILLNFAMLCNSANALTNLCEASERKPCPIDYKTQIQPLIETAAAASRPMLFIFGSHRCKPCLDLKKKIESQNIGANFEIVYLPLRYYPGGGSGKDDSSTHELCMRLFKESASEIKPWSCRGMPTLFLMNPSTRAVKELPASIAEQDTKAKLLNHYRSIATRPAPPTSEMPPRIETDAGTDGP